MNDEESICKSCEHYLINPTEEIEICEKNIEGPAYPFRLHPEFCHWWTSDMVNYFGRPKRSDHTLYYMPVNRLEGSPK